MIIYVCPYSINVLTKYDKYIKAAEMVAESTSALRPTAAERLLLPCADKPALHTDDRGEEDCRATSNTATAAPVVVVVRCNSIGNVYEKIYNNIFVGKFRVRFINKH